mmetsp:Transcript_17253/g.25956  ORF Transcript_17253/g.25956 Transcript_17253/m.25956 type:complete len:308 (+) Transcript_17253:454-1377(+)
MDLETFLGLAPAWASEPCLYIVQQYAGDVAAPASRCGASGTQLLASSEQDLPYGSGGLTGLLGRMTMYNNYWLPFSGRIYAALSIKKQLVAEADRDRTSEDYDGGVYNMDRGSRTLVLAREREFHAELDRRGLRWQQDKRNELFVSTRDNRDLIAALRTIRGQKMHLFTKDAIVEDGAYHGGARRSRITIVDTQPRRTQPRDAAIPSITVRLSSDWLDQLRAGNPSMYARLINIVQRHRPPVETTVRMQPEDVAEMRAGTPRGDQIARALTQVAEEPMAVPPPTPRVTRAAAVREGLRTRARVYTRD